MGHKCDYLEDGMALDMTHPLSLSMTVIPTPIAWQAPWARRDGTDALQI